MVKTWNKESDSLDSLFHFFSDTNNKGFFGVRDFLKLPQSQPLGLPSLLLGILMLKFEL